MTKDEIIESWWPEGSGHSAYSSGACDGASKMYDHRQKEIDEAYDAGWKDSARATQSYALGEMEANRWWASRWQALCCTFGEDNEKLQREMDAAAKRVMEVEG